MNEERIVDVRCKARKMFAPPKVWPSPDPSPNAFRALVFWASAVILLCCLASLPAGAQAAGSITEYSTGFNGDPRPADMITGPDGDLWFTGGGMISKITPSGTVTHYSAGLPAGSEPDSLAVGAEGDLWFTDADESFVDPTGAEPAIGRITPSGTITEFKSAKNQEGNPISLREPGGIVRGPDGNLWFVDAPYQRAEPAIGRITPTGEITEFELPGYSEPANLVIGPDGNLWFTNWGIAPHLQAIGKITPSGVITEYLVPEQWPGDIVSAGGALWFTNVRGAIGKVTTTGTITEYTVGLQTGSSPQHIVVGAEGDLWFTDRGPSSMGVYSGAVGKVTPSGTITELTGHHLAPGYAPASIVVGPDGDIWVGDERGNLDRFSPSGQLTTFWLGLTEEVAPIALTAGPGDQDLWFAESWAPGIGKVSPVTTSDSPTPTVEIEVTEREGGVVTSSPPGINCPGICSSTFAPGTEVTLTATPAANSSVFSSALIVPGEEPCPDVFPPAVPSGVCHFTVSGDALWRVLFSREEGSGGSGGGGGSSGGGSTQAPSPQPGPPPKPKSKKSLECKKGFKAKPVKGKQRCVKAKKKAHHRKGTSA